MGTTPHTCTGRIRELLVLFLQLLVLLDLCLLYGVFGVGIYLFDGILEVRGEGRTGRRSVGREVGGERREREERREGKERRKGARDGIRIYTLAERYS